jgi:hypothetical protein
MSFANAINFTENPAIGDQIATVKPLLMAV